jgi:molecular chaperone HscB
MDYFELYNLPVSFHVDEALVKKKFYELSKKFHPDFYINESDEKQAEILELSTANNKAYQVLSNPLKRIEYVLQLNNLMQEGEKYQLPQDFLMDMMEINEALMELEFNEDPVALEKIRNDIAAIEKGLFDELYQHTTQFDAEANPQNENILLNIKDIWYRQKYLLRIRESLNRFAAR